MTAARAGALALLVAAGACRGKNDPGRAVVVASKGFTEGVILGQMVVELAASTPANVEYKAQLGGTEVVFHALEAGAVDVYPEYTGTLTQEILRKEVAGRSLEEVLADRGLRRTRGLGLDNSYALAMKEARAAALGIDKISDLVAHPELRLVFSNEVMSRADGWPGLHARYALPQEARGMDHDLAYRALASDGVDVMDVYTTDAEIRAYGLRVLKDDRQFFTRYDAILVYRADLEARRPDVVASFKRLEGRIDNATMIGLNARAKLDHVSARWPAISSPRRSALRAAPDRASACSRPSPAGPPSTARWSACRCSPPSPSRCRSGSWRRAGRASAASSSAPPASCRPFRRWRCWCS